MNRQKILLLINEEINIHQKCKELKEKTNETIKYIYNSKIISDKELKVKYTPEEAYNKFCENIKYLDKEFFSVNEVSLSHIIGFFTEIISITNLTKPLFDLIIKLIPEYNYEKFSENVFDLCITINDNIRILYLEMSGGVSSGNIIIKNIKPSEFKKYMLNIIDNKDKNKLQIFINKVYVNNIGNIMLSGNKNDLLFNPRDNSIITIHNRYYGNNNPEFKYSFKLKKWNKNIKTMYKYFVSLYKISEINIKSRARNDMFF